MTAVKQYTFYPAVLHLNFSDLYSCLSSQSDHLNLHWHALWQFLHSNAGTSWLVREILSIDAIHLGKRVHGRQEDGSLQSVMC